MRLGGGALRRAFARGAAVFVVLGTPTCLGILRHLGDTSDSVSSRELQLGGACENGCVRTVVDAQALTLGEIDCELRVQNLLDHIDEDVVGAALVVVHSCSNEQGDLLYEGQGACTYSVCVQAEWREGVLFYSVAVEHEPSLPAVARTVLVQVYMNEYQDLVLPETSSASSAASSGVQCQLGTTCPAASDCGASSSKVDIVLEDSYGDGWIGGLPDRANTWAVTQALSSADLASPVANGTLPERHYAGNTRLCLEDGLYTFSTTADAAWSEESSWTVCGVTGGAGGSLEFEIGDGECSVVDNSSADGPPDVSAETPTEDLCSLPVESPCVDLDVAVQEISGPSIGMYYDEACLAGGGGRTGCGAGGEPACRVCFVNRDFWLADFADERYPDWVDCPCCVAATIGVTCQEGEPLEEPEEPFLDQAEEFYREGSAPLLAGLGGLIGLGLITACCCCRDIRKTNQKALTYKHHKTAAYAGYKDGGGGNGNGNGDTSPDVSPPSRDSYKRSDEFPAEQDVTGSGNDDGGGQDLEAVDLSGKARKMKKKTKLRPGSAGKPPRRGGRGQDDGGDVAPDAADAPDLFGYGGDGAAASRPPLSALPGSARDRPASDASWPSDPRVGVSVSGKKNPRWSGSRELKAYLRRTGYDEMNDGDLHQDEEQQQQQQQQQSGKRRGGGEKHEGGRGGSGGGVRVVQALKKKGGSLLGEKKSERSEFDWVDGPPQHLSREDAEMTTGPFPGDAAGPVVSMGYVDGDNHLGADAPLGEISAMPPAVRAPKPRTESHSRSRSRSRDRSHRRAAGGGDSGGVSGGKGGEKNGGVRGKNSNAAPFEGSAVASSRPISWRLSGGSKSKSKSKPSRVAPTDEIERAADGAGAADEFGLCDQSFLDKTWQAPPEAPSPKREFQLEDDVALRHGGPMTREVRRARAAVGKTKDRGRGRSRGEPVSDVAVVSEGAVDSERFRALKAERRREEEDKLRAEEALKRMEEEESAELERVREARRQEEKEEEARRRKTKQERLRQQQQQQQQQQLEEEEEARRRKNKQERLRQQQQLEEQEGAEAEQQRAERARQQQQQDEDDEKRARRRRQDRPRHLEQDHPQRDVSRERDGNDGVGTASRGRGRGVDERKKRGDGGASRERRQHERGRSVEADVVVDPRDPSESERVRGERARGESHDARDRRRGGGSRGRTQRPRGEGNTGHEDKPPSARANSTPAGPREPEARETEAERRRRRAQEARERRPAQSRSQERKKGSRSRERRGDGSGSIPRGGHLGGGRRSSRNPGREEPPEGEAQEEGRKKSGGTRFSSDPRAKQERAARLKEKRMKASAGRED